MCWFIMLSKWKYNLQFQRKRLRLKQLVKLLEMSDNIFYTAAIKAVVFELFTLCSLAVF